MTEHHPQLAPVYIMVQPGGSKDDKEHYAKTFPRKSMLILSSLQVIASGLAALTQIILFGVRSHHSINDIGAGIWTGLFFGIAGTIGLMAAHRPSHCTIITFMVMSIVASLMSIPLIVFSGIGIGESNYRSDSTYYDNWSDMNTPMSCIQMLCGLMEGVVAITSAAFCCRAVCCGRRANTGMVMFNPQGGTIRGAQNEQGYDAIPMAMGGAMIPDTQQAPIEVPKPNFDAPPNYAEAAAVATPEEGDKYQRFV